MEVTRLPLSATQRGKLISTGYTSLSSLSSATSSDLARDLNITEREACEILKVATSTSSPDKLDGSHAVVNGAKNAWDMLHEESSLMCITTSCADLDSILGGGINCKQVTEIGGVPGIGKTQLGIQLAINVQIPPYCGGLGGKAIYIDTEGSFMVERASQMAEACVEDLSEYSRFLHKNLQACQVEIKCKDILENIYYFRVCTYTEQIDLINHLHNFILEHKDVSSTKL
uniref:DNA repair protein RAD51 homolog 3 n=1 Tax=Rhizophora mucronata TaxID=61149 RepID=A0A2P2IUS0_RHIMU